MKKSTILLFILFFVWNMNTIKAQEGSLPGIWILNLNKAAPAKSEIRILIGKDSLVLQTPVKDVMQSNYFQILELKYLDEFKSYALVESLNKGSVSLKFGLFLFLTLQGKEMLTPGFVFQSPSKEEALKKFETEYASSKENLFLEGNFIMKKEGFYSEISQYPTLNLDAIAAADLLKALESISAQMDTFPLGKIKDSNYEYLNENIFKMRIHWGLEHAGFNPYFSILKFDDLLMDKDSYASSNPEIYKILMAIEEKK